MTEKLPAPCEPCHATGLFEGSECVQCRGKGYRLIGGRGSGTREAKAVAKQTSEAELVLRSDRRFPCGVAAVIQEGSGTLRGFFHCISKERLTQRDVVEL
jgi:hypothetical protein